jgi:hypothetical protein
LFGEIAEYTISLGYIPKKAKTRVFNIDFSKNKLNKTILKLEAPDPKYVESSPGIRLKFYANKDYSYIFKQSIKHVIEEFDGRYTGCYGCGKCKGTLEGYIYTYSDGKNIFRCGGELISIKDWHSKNLSEIKQLMKVQDEFWFNQINAS